VLERNRQVQLTNGLGAHAQVGIFVRAKEPRDPYRKSRIRPLVHFPLELKLPRPITLPPIPRKGRGRPAELTNARARTILALTCTGATVEMIAAAGGVTPSTLRNWLTRRDHAAYRVFQEAFAAAETYAAYVALKAIMEGLAADPKLALEFLARRYPDQWGKVEGQEETSGKREGDTLVVHGIKADLGSMLERVFQRVTSQKHYGPLSIDRGLNGTPHPRDPRPPRETNGHP
jgi:transposase-like protein